MESCPHDVRAREFSERASVGCVLCSPTNIRSPHAALRSLSLARALFIYTYNARAALSNLTWLMMMMCVFFSYARVRPCPGLDGDRGPIRLQRCLATTQLEPGGGRAGTSFLLLDSIRVQIS